MKLKIKHVIWRAYGCENRVRLTNDGKALLSVVKGREKHALKNAILRNY